MQYPILPPLLHKSASPHSLLHNNLTPFPTPTPRAPLNTDCNLHLKAPLLRLLLGQVGGLLLQQRGGLDQLGADAAQGAAGFGERGGDGEEGFGGCHFGVVLFGWWGVLVEMVGFGGCGWSVGVSG